MVYSHSFTGEETASERVGQRSENFTQKQDRPPLSGFADAHYNLLSPPKLVTLQISV